MKRFHLAKDGSIAKVPFVKRWNCRDLVDTSSESPVLENTDLSEDFNPAGAPDCQRNKTLVSLQLK
jgi:hypothetical protein